MLRLGPRSRGALAVAGLTAFASAYAATPLVAGEVVAPLAIDPPVSLSLKPAPARSIAAAITPRRDPFAGIPEALGASPVPNAAPGAGQPAAVPTLPPLPSLPALPDAIGAIGVLPANAGAGLGLPPSEPLRVTAVITGAHPSAIVEDRNGTRLVTVGDAVGDDHVDAIDAAGVHAAHGTVYPVSPAGQPPLSPVRTRPMPARPVPANPASSPQPIPSGGLP